MHLTVHTLFNPFPWAVCEKSLIKTFVPLDSQTGSWGPRNLLRGYSTSYQSTLSSFKSLSFTVSEKNLTNVHTDRRTWVKLYALDELSRGHKNIKQITYEWRYPSTVTYSLYVPLFQTASSSLFGIGSQQTKLLKQFATQPLPITNLTNLLKLVRLVWIDNRTLILLTLDGSETKYTI